MLPSFFFTNRTGAPQGEELDRMNPFSNRSSNCFFSSANSAGAIRYGALAIGFASGSKVIVKGLFRGGGNSFNDAKTSSNSWTTSMSSILTSLLVASPLTDKVTKYTSPS
ncbi:hypothetical protein Bca4012_026420 [Brassica carinata]